MRPRTFAPLLSGRRVPPSFGPDVFAVFFALGAFWGLLALASFLALGAAVFLVAAFFEAGFSGATFAPCAATAAAWSVVVVFVSVFFLVVSYPSARLAHDDSSLRSAA